MKEIAKNPLRHFGIAKDLPDEVNDEFENAIHQPRIEDTKLDTERFSKLPVTSRIRDGKP